MKGCSGTNVVLCESVRNVRAVNGQERFFAAEKQQEESYVNTLQ